MTRNENLPYIWQDYSFAHSSRPTGLNPCDFCLCKECLINVVRLSSKLSVWSRFNLLGLRCGIGDGVVSGFLVGRWGETELEEGI